MTDTQTTDELSRETAALYHEAKRLRTNLAASAGDENIDNLAEADLQLENAQLALRRAFHAMTRPEETSAPIEAEY